MRGCGGQTGRRDVGWGARIPASGSWRISRRCARQAPRMPMRNVRCRAWEGQWPTSVQADVLASLGGEWRIFAMPMRRKPPRATPCCICWRAAKRRQRWHLHPHSAQAARLPGRPEARRCARGTFWVEDTQLRIIRFVMRDTDWRSLIYRIKLQGCKGG